MTPKTLLLALVLLVAALMPAAISADSHGEHAGHTATKAPEDAKLYFISPEDGDTVKSPLTIRFGLAGMGIAPAGVTTPNTGHHHLFIDADGPVVGQAIPADANHVHFGGGQTEVTIELAPGKHTLQLVLGDHGHVPHDPLVVSDKITVTAE